MVSKVFSRHSFYHACRYVVNKPEAEVLECTGVREHNYQVMSDDFILQQQLRPEKEKACFHCCLSFYPGEKVSDEQMKQIAKEYLERLKSVDTRVAIDGNMRNAVIGHEEENQRKFEMWQKSLELEKEAKELKQKVSGGVRKK